MAFPTTRTFERVFTSKRIDSCGRLGYLSSQSRSVRLADALVDLKVCRFAVPKFSVRLVSGAVPLPAQMVGQEVVGRAAFLLPRKKRATPGPLSSI